MHQPTIGVTSYTNAFLMMMHSFATTAMTHQSTQSSVMDNALKSKKQLQLAALMTHGTHSQEAQPTANSTSLLKMKDHATTEVALIQRNSAMQKPALYAVVKPRNAMVTAYQKIFSVAQIPNTKLTVFAAIKTK